MTDEAKEYLKDICPICNDREVCLQDGCNCYIEQAYLDGLAEGRKEKWHDLRKDSNDLPKESGYYLVSRYSNYLRRKRHTQTLFYIKGKRNGWDTKMDKTQIIAWCEIPMFEE